MKTKYEIEEKTFKLEKNIKREHRIMEKHIDSGDVITAEKYERAISRMLSMQTALRWVLRSEVE